MARNKKEKKIGVAEYVMACRCGEFEANKEIVGRLRCSTFKSKKAYSRKEKYKKGWA